MNLKTYWDQAMSFEEYLKLTKTLTENPEMQQEAYQDYYHLGLQRMERVDKNYTPAESEIQQMEAKNFQGKILIITEPWCGDAASIVPVVTRFLMKAQVPVRLFLRDKDTALIDGFLTNGGRAIPKILIADEDFEIIASWGPRRKFGADLLAKFKADPENYPREKFYADLQKAYAKDKGKEIIAKLLALIP